MQWQTTCNDRGMYKEQGKLHNGVESLLGSEKKKKKNLHCRIEEHV